MTTNPGYESDHLGNEQEAEAVFLDSTHYNFEDKQLGYGDVDTHGCWHRFCGFMRKFWATRTTEDTRSDRELFIKTTLRELLIYIFFMITLVTIAFGMLDSKAFYMTEAVRDVLMNTPVEDSDLTLASVNSIDDYWDVLKGPLIHTLYDNQWYNSKLISGNDTYYLGYESVRLGLIRIRQVRVTNHSCSIPDDFAQQITSCYGVYSDGIEDRSTYGPGNSTAWVYTSGDELKMGIHFGTVAVYGGGGYYLDLPQDENMTLESVTELFQNLWVDRGTSAIFLHFTVYNSNANLFCVVSLVAELPPTGGILIGSEFRTVKLLRYVRTQDYVVLMFECFFLLFIVYYVAEEVIEACNLGYKYFTKFWNILDILVVVLSCICAGFNIYRTVRVKATLSSLLANPNEYSNFERLSYWEMQFNYAVGILVFLVWIKIFKYVSFNKTMNQLNLTLANCAKDIAGFGVMFFIVFFAFAQLGYLAFGTQVADFSTFATSLMTLFRIILGDFDFQALHDAQSFFGPLYFLVYIFFVFFVLINMFIAIINDTYLEVKSNLLNQPSEFQMKSFFKQRLKDMRNKMKQKKSQLQEIQDAIDAVATEENDMSIDDLKAEMNGEASGAALDKILRKVDTNNDMKLDTNERRALRETLENKKMSLMQEMFNFQEAEIGHSYEQFSKLLTTRVASKEDMDRAYMRLIRLENCIKNVTERLRSMVRKLEQSEEVKNKRTEQMQNLLENLVSAVHAPPPPPLSAKPSFDHQGSVDATEMASVAPTPMEGVRKRPDRNLSFKGLTRFGRKHEE
ncbi:polycystic kidney disease protein 2 [Echinococcus multilocularis]|uniref:Polycystic kidney disease protein 2 n=1 Tax=Echinococcus multilocularis TaxID=6211 RepID=A0A068YFY8_ECHMU|nr:polycystic kidney disease protein 2 [Echinococcus multilocularis]